MTADRAKAAELAGEHQHWCHWEGHGDCCAADAGIPEDDYCDCGVGTRRKSIAAALAAARADVEARWTARVQGLAEEWEGRADDFTRPDRVDVWFKYAAARLRGLVTGSEEQQ